MEGVQVALLVVEMEGVQVALLVVEMEGVQVALLVVELEGVLVEVLYHNDISRETHISKHKDRKQMSGDSVNGIH
jgi:hypothetical protein